MLVPHKWAGINITLFNAQKLQYSTVYLYIVTVNKINQLMSQTKEPITNCHAHIFTGNNVPPFLAKTFLFWPFHIVLNTPFILLYFKIVSWFKTYPTKPWFKKIKGVFYNYASFVRRNFLANLINHIANFWLIAHVLFYLFAPYIKKMLAGFEFWLKIIELKNWLAAHHLILLNPPTALKVTIIIFVFVFIRIGRKLILLVAKNMYGLSKVLPSKNTIKFIGRYLNIGRFANYKESSDILVRLRRQYEDEKTRFVILPMDMEFMDAGKPFAKGRYEKQMEELAAIKNNHKAVVFPFVFVDPRREKVGDKIFFDYDLNQDGKIVLKDCFIKDYIENKKFSGFKIYPALGYYPFDEKLLPIWKYAAQENLPIMTHAIRGNIFYRGKKKKEWGRHPIFDQATGGGTFDEKLLLPELKNIDFINNFTHPLNFLCLLDKSLLIKVLSLPCTSDETKELFGYTKTKMDNGNEVINITSDLSNLKICLGHYGGDDEWEKYLESDRDNAAASLIRESDKGVDFFVNSKTGEPIPGKIEQLWYDCDWYTICSSLMLQYPNVYADISYIIHSEKIFPLLKNTLHNPKLRTRVLYGTDFYVVRNHKSEKDILMTAQALLSEDEFDAIARCNPLSFLNLPNHLPPCNTAT
jgi:predicted TIM-barrel fold metal-dependent hydrolase